ncbi:C69 family dipeptidase [Bacteroidales bacterium OttesenSCG-928-B11]|nr:C69 family dipeptidase [Bacteroidales bacterium OttesenSCG-928-E04]MDL2312010.1 C69 family dipeptidase [Bacteroidales bacterium OttesenSCG-928-B11]
MKKVILPLIIALFCLGSAELNACTNFIVTKGASADGSVMVTYAADAHVLYGELYYTPAGTHPDGAKREVIEWDTGNYLGEIPQIAKTYSVVGNMNEHQLAISETTYGGREELGKGNGIIDYGSLIYITLERAKNAREAIQVLDFLLNNYGYCSSGESFSIIDPNEAWIFELIGKGEEMKNEKGKTVKGWTKGAVWVARRVPDGYISGHANQARITTFPLRDGVKSITNKEMAKIFNPEVETAYSHDVISFAKLKGYYAEKAPDAEFSFCDAYAPLDFSAARYCEARVWAGFYRCNEELMKPYEDYARGDNLKNRMPLWILPKKKLTVNDVMELMRDHYEGTSMDMTKDAGAGPFACPYRWRPMTWELNGKTYLHERATATQQTGFSFVAQCRSGLPDKFGGILWFGVDDAASSCYVPMFCGITEIPMEFAVGNGSMVDYSPTAAFWRFTKVSNFAYSRYSDMIVHIKEKQHGFEQSFVNEIKNMEKEMIDLFQKNPAAAQKRINEYSKQKSREVCQAWDDLFAYLLVKYNDGNVKKEENGKFKKTDGKVKHAVSPNHPRYPDKWYQIIVDDCGKNIDYKETKLILENYPEVK